MKIALTGAHGTGKSTLANFLKDAISKKDKTASITPEVPRIICDWANDKEYFRRNKNSALKQTLILLGQLIIENRKHNADIQICDRTLLDHWAYTLYLFEEDFRKDGLIEIYEKFIVQYCMSYDRIFYIPIEFKPIDDGTRESDIKFQQEIDKKIVHLMDKNSIKYGTITGSIENRSNQILQNL